MLIKEIYVAAGLSALEIKHMPLYIGGYLDFFDTSEYNKLYEYFAFETEEMPYATAKARDADPDTWILKKLERFPNWRNQ